MKKLSDHHLLLLEKGEICCDDIVDIMGDYVDGELTASRKGKN